MQYDSLSGIYDEFNGGFDYAKYLDTAFSRFSLPEKGLCLDCGCGTGSLLCELYARGYDCTGVDASPEMLDITRKKLESMEKEPHLVCQDLTELDLYGAYDIVFCTLDTVNHILDKRGLKSFFTSIYNFTEPNGYFVFDIKTKAAFEDEKGVRCFDDNDGTMIMSCGFERSYASYDFTFFTKKSDGLYERHTDFVEERLYTTDDMKSLIAYAGFEYAGLVRTKNRVIFAARKNCGQ